MNADLPLPARFYSSEETPDICRTLQRAGLHNLSEFVLTLMEELESCRSDLLDMEERAERAESDAETAEDTIKELKECRKNFSEELEKLESSADVKAHRKLLENIEEALEHLLDA